jgi:hypothetical protein
MTFLPIADNAAGKDIPEGRDLIAAPLDDK